jgi:predicted SprT family Zn-dependent metalloprotease
MQDRYEAIRSKTQEVLALAQRLYGVDIKPTIGFNLTGRVAGWAGCKTCRMTFRRIYTLRFNQQMIAGKHFEDIRDETVPHEVAHLVCYARPELGRKHDAGWRRVCLALGGNGRTRHDYDVVVAGGWDYITNLGHKVTIGARPHARVQQGQTLVFRHGKGMITRSSPHARSGQPIQMPGAAPVQRPPAAPAARAAMPAPTPVQPAHAGVAGSFADRVRAVIREARAAGRTPDWVVQHAIAVLGMKDSSARNCVKANWTRA